MSNSQQKTNQRTQNDQYSNQSNPKSQSPEPRVGNNTVKDEPLAKRTGGGMKDEPNTGRQSQEDALVNNSNGL